MTGGRHLRAVPPPEQVTTVQVAGMPGAFAVRRAGLSEAILHRSSTGGWYVMYGYDPDAGDVGSVTQWRGTATLPGDLPDDLAVQACVELVDAYELGVPGWHQLIAAALDASPLMPLLSLHRPVPQTDGTVVCAAEAVQLPWDTCPTVRIIAGSLGVALPGARPTMRVPPVPETPPNR